MNIKRKENTVLLWKIRVSLFSHELLPIVSPEKKFTILTSTETITLLYYIVLSI